MQQRFVILISVICFGLVCAISCKPKTETQPTPADGNFPPAVAAIFINKCATSGCHNSASYQNADSLLLDSWAGLFKGSEEGAEVVPYSTQFSSLLEFINTDTFGTTVPIATPTMPLNSFGAAAPLTKAEFMTLYNWIAAGAPDANGNIAFATNPDTRQKIYLTQQGCDLMAVIDAQSMLVMRYIPIGVDPSVIESPHCVQVSDNGIHAYVSFLNGNDIQQIDTRTDQVTGAANVGSLIPGGQGGSWNILHLSPMDTALVTSDWQGDGLVGTVNTTAMQVETSKTEEGSGLFVYPHGIASNPTFDTFWVTGQYGNVVYEISLSKGPFYKQISIDGKAPQSSGTDSTNSSSPNPHQIMMTPDFSEYFVTCQSTNEVRILDAHTNAIKSVIPVGGFPQEIAISTSKHCMYVTCMQDEATNVVGAVGSVYVIDYTTNQLVKTIYGDFYQPHGICVDEQDGLLYIASTNANPNGPAPHHVSSCGGRDGWYTVYNLNTLQPASHKRFEVTVMPYSAATRFH